MTTTATTTVIAELARRVGVPVSSRMPSTPKPQAFIIVSRIGGGMEDWALRNPKLYRFQFTGGVRLLAH